jgi:hypothetical protein
MCQVAMANKLRMKSSKVCGYSALNSLRGTLWRLELWGGCELLLEIYAQLKLSVIITLSVCPLNYPQLIRLGFLIYAILRPLSHPDNPSNPHPGRLGVKYIPLHRPLHRPLHVDRSMGEPKRKFCPQLANFPGDSGTQTYKLSKHVECVCVCGGGGGGDGEEVSRISSVLAKNIKICTSFSNILKLYSLFYAYVGSMFCRTPFSNSFYLWSVFVRVGSW